MKETLHRWSESAGFTTSDQKVLIKYNNSMSRDGLVLALKDGALQCIDKKDAQKKEMKEAIIYVLNNFKKGLAEGKREFDTKNAYSAIAQKLMSRKDTESLSKSLKKEFNSYELEEVKNSLKEAKGQLDINQRCILNGKTILTDCFKEELLKNFFLAEDQKTKEQKTEFEIMKSYDEKLGAIIQGKHLTTGNPEKIDMDSVRKAVSRTNPVVLLEYMNPCLNSVLESVQKGGEFSGEEIKQAKAKESKDDNERIKDYRELRNISKQMAEACDPSNINPISSEELKKQVPRFIELSKKYLKTT